MKKKITLYLLILAIAQAVITTVTHIFMLNKNDWTFVFNNYIKTLAMGEIQPILDLIMLCIKWVTVIGEKLTLPLNDTLHYLWTYKITWVGAILIVGFVIHHFIFERNSFRY